MTPEWGIERLEHEDRSKGRQLPRGRHETRLRNFLTPPGGSRPGPRRGAGYHARRWAQDRPGEFPASSGQVNAELLRATPARPLPRRRREQPAQSRGVAKVHRRRRRQGGSSSVEPRRPCLLVRRPAHAAWPKRRPDPARARARARVRTPRGKPGRARNAAPTVRCPRSWPARALALSSDPRLPGVSGPCEAGLRARAGFRRRQRPYR